VLPARRILANGEFCKILFAAERSADLRIGVFGKSTVSRRNGVRRSGFAEVSISFGTRAQTSVFDFSKGVQF
jgi:hypothetical protein